MKYFIGTLSGFVTLAIAFPWLIYIGTVSENYNNYCTWVWRLLVK